MGVFDTIGDFLGIGVRTYPDPYRERTKNFAEGYTGDEDEAEKELAPWATAEPELGEGEEAQKYMGLSPAEWERIGGFGTSVAGKAIGAGVGAGKSLLDWNLERKEQNRLKEMQAKGQYGYNIAGEGQKTLDQIGEDAEIKRKRTEEYLSGRQERWDIERKGKEFMASDTKARKEKEALLLEEERIKKEKEGKLAIDTENRAEMGRLEKDLTDKYMKEKYPPDGIPPDISKESVEISPGRPRSSLKIPELMEPVPSLLGTANKQSLLNKVKEMPARFITKLTEMDQAQTQREQQKSIHRQGLIDNPEMKPGYDPWSDAEGYPKLQTGYDPKTGLNKLTKEYWEESEKEFKSLKGQYRILDPTNKYKDVIADPSGNRDQRVKAHLMRRADRALTGKKWYSKGEIFNRGYMGKAGETTGSGATY